MIWALIIIAITTSLGTNESGGPDLYKKSLDNWEKAIKRYVGDDEREKQAEILLKETRSSIKEARQGSGKALAQYFEVDQRYDATMVEYEAAIATMNDFWLAADKQLADDRYALKEVLTEKEWAKCTKYTKKKMAKIRKNVIKSVKKQQKERAKQLKKREKNNS
jgi:hypothetical protein